MEGQFEIGCAFFSIAFSLNQITVWMTPAFWLIVLYKVTNRHLQGQNMASLNFSTLNQMFNSFSALAMISLLVSIIPWI